MVNFHDKQQRISSFVALLLQLAHQSNDEEFLLGDSVDIDKAARQLSSMTTSISNERKVVAIENYFETFISSIARGSDQTSIKQQCQQMCDALISLRSCDSIEFLESYDAVSVPVDCDALRSVVLCFNTTGILSIILISGWSCVIEFFIDIDPLSPSNANLSLSTNTFRELNSCDLISDAIFIGLNILYKRSSQSPVALEPCIHFRNDHIGHFYWNDMCGLVSMRDKLGTKPDMLISVDISKYCFLLPELSLHSNDCRQANNIGFSRSTIINFLIDNPHKFLFASINRKVPLSVLARTKRRDKLDKRENLSIVVNIRLQDRHLVNQAECLSAYCNSMLALGLMPKIFLTGINDDGRMQNYSDGRELIERELEIAKKIIGSLSYTCDYEILIGCSIEDELNVLDSLKQPPICLTPWGAGLAKYMWMRRYPCYIYSNTSVLKNLNGDLYIYSNPAFVEDSSMHQFARIDHVVDIETSIADKTRKDYLIDPIKFVSGALGFTSECFL